MTHQLDPLTFPLHGTRLIEASAGTGKTYTIAALYLRLVLGHGNADGFSRALTPPEILVMTFTNAATQELRDRIRVRLNQAAGYFRNRAEEDPYLEALRDAFPQEQWDNCARLLDQAAQWMDEAAIYTIHSWCQRMLRQHAFDSGSLFDLDLEPDDQDLLEEAACDYWRSVFYPLPVEKFTEMIRLCGCKTPQVLLEKVKPLFDHITGPPEDPFEVLEKRCKAIETARRQWEPVVDTAIELVKSARAEKALNGNKYRLGSLDKWTGQLVGWVHAGGPLPEDKTRQQLSYAGLQDALNKNKSLPEHPAFTIFERLNEQLALLKVDTALYRHAARDIVRRFDREKTRRGQMGYDDLLTRLSDALQKPDGRQLARVIRHQFPVALIDEFQDTDPIQYAALGRIYLGRSDVGLFMIGDPKQAIYAFRGADIHTYLQARKESAGHHYTLGKNYRSNRGMVKSANRMFDAAAGHRRGTFLYGDQIPFEPVDVEGGKGCLEVDGQPAESMQFWYLPQGDPIAKTGDKGYLAQMADAFADQMVRLLNKGNAYPPEAGFRKTDAPLVALRPADIAVLVKDGQEAKAIRKSLAQRNVRSVYLSDKESIFTSAEAQEILYLLQACAEPTRAGRVKAALATPLLALPLARLDALNQDETAWEAEINRFCAFQRRWQQRGVLPMLRELLQAFNVPARLMSNPGGERSLTNILHLSEILQGASRRLEGHPALIRWLAQMIAQPPGESEEQIIRLESDEALIRVITIHKSKGLEYPVVFLPFICTFRQVGGRGKTIVKYHDGQGRLKVVLDPDEEDLKKADTERLAEDLRLLYVAVTRARFACYLGIGVIGKVTKKDGKVSHLHLSGIGYLLSGNNTIATEAVPSHLEKLKGDCGDIAIDPLPASKARIYMPPKEDIDLTPPLAFTGRIPSDWWIASYSAILAEPAHDARPNPGQTHSAAHTDAGHSAIEERLREVELAPAATSGVRATPTIHLFPKGPQPGTFLHDLLEWAADEGFGTTADAPRSFDERIRQRCTTRGWDNWPDILSRWLLNFLTTPLRLPEDQGEVALADLKKGDYQPELEFLFAAHNVDVQTLDRAVRTEIKPEIQRIQLQSRSINGMLKGFIDLAFCHQGRYYVMDYKSNYLGEDESAYGTEALTEAMLSHRYDLQYVLYTLAMHRLLKARLPDYDYDRDMGGAVYVFLRGIEADSRGVYVDKPPRSLITELDAHFTGGENTHAA